MLSQFRLVHSIVEAIKQIVLYVGIVVFSVRWYQIWVGPFLIYWLSVLVIDETLFLFCEILWSPGQSLSSCNVVHQFSYLFPASYFPNSAASSFKKYFQFSLHCKFPIKGDRDKWHGVFIKSILKQNISGVTRWGRKNSNRKINNNNNITRTHNFGADLRRRRKMWSLLVGGV